MSYDISLVIDTGGSEPAEVAEVGNHTYNCWEMFARAIGLPLGELDEQIAGDVLPSLRAAVAYMLDDPAYFQALNPPNGWGSYETALEYLQDLVKACEAHPRATIRVT